MTAHGSFDAVVLGAGPAGLAAARAVARTGRSVALVERADRVGGMAGSFEVGGQRVDFGSHRLHPAADPAVLADLRSHRGADLQVRPRHGRVRLAGRWVGFPLRTTDLARSLPRTVAARAALDAIAAPTRRAKADTYAQVVRAQLGPTILREFYGPYAEKLWARPAGELDGELARRRISAGSTTDLLRRLARARQPEGRTFLYPAHGFGQIADRLAEAAVAEGVVLMLNQSVTKVAAASDRVELQIEVTPGDHGIAAAIGTLDAGLCVSTLPVTRLVSLLEARPPAAVQGAAPLEHRGMALVYLIIDRPRYTEFDAHYFPGPDTAMSRLSEPKNYRHAPRTDPAATTVLCAELPCTVGDKIWRSGDQELAAQVEESLRSIGLPRPMLVGHQVVRLPHVYPVYEVGFADRLASLLAWVAVQPRVVTLGRQGLFVADNTHHALAMGTALGACLAPDGTVDPAQWAEALSRFARHVVED